MRTLILTVCTYLIHAAVTFAADNGFDDFRQGDLIFQETTGRQSVAVKAATGSPYTHVGIVRITGGGPMVIEAGRTVTETELGEFVGRGKGSRFAVYRANALTEAKAHKVVESAYKDMGKPYDLFFRMDPQTIYCSELPYRAFRAAGVPVGEVERIGDLNIAVAAAVALIDRRWEKHPDCTGESKAACMKKLARQDIITPVGLARDPNLTRVFSNF